MAQQRGLIARLTSFVRWLFLALLVCAAGLVVGRQFLAAQLDEQIRLQVESLVAQHYPYLDVHVAGARRVEGTGIEIRGFSIRAKAGDAALRQWVYVDEMLLTCSTDLTQLLGGVPQVRQLTLRRLKVQATCDQEGQWNLATLLPLPELGGPAPRVIVEDSAVDLKDFCRRPEAGLALREISAQLQAETSADGTVRWHLSGTLRGDHFKHVRIQGQTDPACTDWSLWGTIDGLEMTQRMLDALPADVAEHVSCLTALQARAHFEFRLGYRRGTPEPLDFLLQGHLAEGRVDDPRVPLPLTDLEADVFWDNRQLRIEQVTARSGPTTLALSYHCDGVFTAAPVWALSARVSRLTLDERIYQALPESLQAEWNKFAPRGTIDLEGTLSLADGCFQPDFHIICRDVSFSYYRFPLRLQQGRGTLQVAGNTIRIPEFLAVANGQTVRLAAELQDPGPHVTGWLTVASDGPQPLNDEFIAAMPPTGRRIMHTLHPGGAFTIVQGRLERQAPDQPTDVSWDVQLNDCTLEYERFPYAIQNITGRVVIAGQRWEFRDLRGFHGSNYLTCAGDWTPASDDQPGGDLTLHFKSWDVPLDDSLRGAIGKLNPGVERLWDSLRPRGSVDHVMLTVHHSASTNQTRLDLRGEKWPPTQNVPGRSISLQPTWLPLQLDDVTGSLSFADGRFQLYNVSADRNGSRVELAGHGQATPDQRWEITLERLIADRLEVDRDFIEAMPEVLRPALRQLKYRGTVSVNGNSWFGGGATQPLLAGWDLLLDLEDGALENELRLEHIHGGLRLTGRMDAVGMHSRGELEIDSLMTRGVQFTQVRGPFWLDPRQLTLGSQVLPAQPGQVPRQVTAKAVGGEVALDAQVLLDNELHFGADVSLSNGQVVELAQAMYPGGHSITGKVFALAHLQGAKAGLHTLQGHGQVRLREADIYELPLMARLLSVLSLRDPDDKAFTSSDVDFRINGEQIYLDRIDFSGDVLSLKGKGWMDMNRRVNLDFYALVGREEFQLPLVKTLLTEASKNILQIQVVGTVDQPQLIRKPLPELDDTLQRIFPESVPRTANPQTLWK